VTTGPEQAQPAAGAATGTPGGGAAGAGSTLPDDEPRVVVRDKRRLDPETGQVREPGTSAAAAAGEGHPTALPDDEAAARAESAAAEQTDARIAELVDDIKRLKAEYDNYRRRVERDRQATVDAAHAAVLASLLPVLDDIERARAHGDLVGTFATIGDQLVSTVTKQGLERFGEPGEPFDPSVHEALVHTTAPGLSGPTAVEVYRGGYRYAGRVLRPAQVVVADSDGTEGAGAAAG
jgi:molecular chaperone GrpE